CDCSRPRGSTLRWVLDLEGRDCDPVASLNMAEPSAHRSLWTEFFPSFLRNTDKNPRGDLVMPCVYHQLAACKTRASSAFIASKAGRASAWPTTFSISNGSGGYPISISPSRIIESVPQVAALHLGLRGAVSWSVWGSTSKRIENNRHPG